MNLEEKLYQLKSASSKTRREVALEKELAALRYWGRIRKPLPAQRVAKSIDEYVDGRVGQHAYGECFLAEETLPLGRPYGKMRIGDIATSVLSPLGMFLAHQTLPEASRLVFLDTETTGLADDSGACAFLIGLGTVEGAGFVIRQYFLRDYTEEKAALALVAEALENYDGVVTFNGKAFDVPLLETRYALSGIASPFSRLVHFDLLHPARRLWKLRLESCHLTNLEKHLLGIAREGDVPGSEIPGIYFDYLRTGDGRGLQGVFFHNSLDIISLAALSVEAARHLSQARDGGCAQQITQALDLFSLGRIFERAGEGALALAMCREAIRRGLPEAVEPRALWLLARQHKRLRQYEAAAETWIELTRRGDAYVIEAYWELSLHHERRLRDFEAALRFTESALEFLAAGFAARAEGAARSLPMERFQRRRARLEKRLVTKNRDRSHCGGRAEA